MSKKYFTHTQLLNKECSHEEYYAPFLSERMENVVLSRIGLERIRASTDPHFNDIPLQEWDNLPYLSGVGEVYREKTGDWMTISTWVSMYKQAAHRIKQMEKSCRSSS
jgi:hypothetical protein